MLRIALLGDLHYFRMEDRFQPADELKEACRLFFETLFRAFLSYEAFLSGI